MSKGNLPGNRNTPLTLVIIASLVAAAYAADPNAPPDPNASSGAKRPVAKASTTPPVSKPAPPAKRTPASFTRDMSFGEAIDILRNCTTPPLNIVVLWKEVGENAGIYKDTPIGIDGIPGLRVGQYLDLLVLSLSAGASDKIGYAVHQGVITVARTSSLPAPRYVTRVHDVRDLVAPPSTGFNSMGFGGMGYGGMYGNQMMGLGGSYGGGLGTGYGLGSSYFPGGGLTGPGGLPGLVGNSYGGTRARSGLPRGR